MSARKVVINQGLILIFGLSSSAAIYAQTTPVKRKDGKTVGDLLKRIETTTKKVQFSKAKASLPQIKKETVTPITHENLAQIKPPSRSAMYYEEGTNEAQLEHVSDQGINQLYKLSQQFKTSKRRGELWLRLAELYVEKSRLIEYKLQQKYDDQIRDFQ